MGAMAEKKKKSSSSFGTLFWIAFILLVIILFVYNKDPIFASFSKISSSELFSGKKKIELNGDSAKPVTPQVTTKDELSVATGSGESKGDGSLVPVQPAQEPANATPAAVPVAEKTTAAQNPPVEKNREQPAPAAKQNQPKKTAEPSSQPATKPVKPAKQKPAKAAEKPVPPRSAKLYFVVIDADGKVVRKEVSREIAQTDSPLSETLQTLFRGANSSESGKGLRSLIPTGTKLLSATVKNGVASINLSDEFQFNQYGIEGYLGQLSQVVFTATTFPTVTSVQFLIEGQRREYLGAEGVWIGTPLSREKF